MMKSYEREPNALSLLFSNLKALDEVLSGGWIDKKLHGSHTGVGRLQCSGMNERDGSFGRQDERRRLAHELRHSLEVVVRIEIVGHLARFRKRARRSGPH